MQKPELKRLQKITGWRVGTVQQDGQMLLRLAGASERGACVIPGYGNRAEVDRAQLARPDRGQACKPSGEGSLLDTRGVSAACCPTGLVTGHSTSGHTHLAIHPGVWPASTLEDSSASEDRCWSLGWAQTHSQGGVLRGHMWRAFAKPQPGPRPRGNEEPHCRGLRKGHLLWSRHTCWWRPRRSVRAPRCCSSPCSAPSRCLLKCGKGRLGLKSELSMLTGASMMEALVTGPVVGQAASQAGHRSHHSSNLSTYPRVTQALSSHWSCLPQPGPVADLWTKPHGFMTS